MFGLDRVLRRVAVVFWPRTLGGAAEGHLRVRLSCLQLHVLSKIALFKYVAGHSNPRIDKILFMQAPFKVDVYKAQSHFSYLNRGFLKCIVTSTTSPFQSRQFAYCLQCRKMKSISWFNDHKKTVHRGLSPQQVGYFHAKFDFFCQDIVTEVEFLNETGGCLLKEGKLSAESPAVASKRNDFLISPVNRAMDIS